MADQFEPLLKAWGVAYAERRIEVDPAERYSRTAAHPIATSMQFAAGKKVRRTVSVLRESGIARRLVHGRAAGLNTRADGKGRTLPVPRWATDPIRCKESPPGVGANRVVHPDLARVDQAVRALEEEHPIRGLCLRVNYCIAGLRDEKVEEVNARLKQLSRFHQGIEPTKFANEVAFGKVWVQGWLKCSKDAA